MRPDCLEPGCVQPAMKRGYCNRHYRQKLADESLPRTHRRNKGRTCTAPGCSKPARTRALCGACYARGLRLGTIDANRKARTPARPKAVASLSSLVGGAISTCSA